MTKLERVQKVVKARLDNTWRLYEMHTQDGEEEWAQNSLNEFCILQAVAWLFDNDKYLADMEEIYFG